MLHESHTLTNRPTVSRAHTLPTANHHREGADWTGTHSSLSTLRGSAGRATSLHSTAYRDIKLTQRQDRMHALHRLGNGQDVVDVGVAALRCVAGSRVHGVRFSRVNGGL